MAFKRVEAKLPTLAFNKIAIVKDMPSVDEALKGEFGHGNDTDLLRQLLHRAGIEYSSCYVTSVLREYPLNGDIKRLFMGKLEAKAKDFSGMQHKLGVLRPEYFHEFLRLFKELAAIKPNVIIALGELALWALTRKEGIKTYRGTVIPSVCGKVVASYSLEDAFKKWDMLPVIAADFSKAARESLSPESSFKRRTIYVAENKEDLDAFHTTWHSQCNRIAFDVETDPTPPRITSYSIAPNSSVALVVDVDKLGDGWALGYYLPRWVDKVWIGHNILYDLVWVELYGIKPERCEDTMLMHHSWQLELQKGLGFVGSLHCNEMPWKELRVKAKSKINKEGD